MDWIYAALLVAASLVSYRFGKIIAIQEAVEEINEMVKKTKELEEKSSVNINKGK